MSSETKEHEPTMKPIKLTKKGQPDKRQQTCRANLKKANSVIKQAIDEIKSKKKYKICQNKKGMGRSMMPELVSLLRMLPF